MEDVVVPRIALVNIGEEEVEMVQQAPEPITAVTNRRLDVRVPGCRSSSPESACLLRADRCETDRIAFAALGGLEQSPMRVPCAIRCQIFDAKSKFKCEPEVTTND